ncbi:MAG TPA: glutaredoxin [Candidatus Eremiobacteraceae bacterium]|nr:glutaredoxin [Candidatus Eremiobacteraceae bacterium]
MGSQPAKRSNLKLYAADWCWYCRRVVDCLRKLGLDYEYVEVPVFHSQRTEVRAVSGQTSVPVLVDGDVVLDDDDTIIPYLEEHYGTPKSEAPPL